MNYIGLELYKIVKSIQAKVGFLLISILIIPILAQIKISGQSVSAMDIVCITLGNLYRTTIFQVITVLIASLLFSSEFSGSTIKYIMIRPVFLWKLFFAKIVAVWIYSAGLLLFIFFLSSISGLIFWDIRPLHGPGQAELGSGWLRIFILYFSSWFNTIFIISLALLFGVILKKQVSTIIVTMGTYFLLAFSTSFYKVIEEVTPLKAHYINPYLWESSIKYIDIFQGNILSFVYALLLINLSFYFIKRAEVI